MNTLFCIGENYAFAPLRNYAIRYGVSLLGGIHCVYFWDCVESVESKDSKGFLGSVDSSGTSRIDSTNVYDSDSTAAPDSANTLDSTHSSQMDFKKADSKKANFKADFFSILKFSLQTSQNLLILACDSALSGILDYFQKAFLLTPTLEGSGYNFRLKDCTILLQSSATIPQNRIPQAPIPQNQIPHPQILQTPIPQNTILQNDAPNRTFLYLLGLDCQSALILLSPLADSRQIRLQGINETCGIEILEARADCQNAPESLESFLQEMRQTFQNRIFPSANLTQSIIQLLADSKQKITTTESCTGGLLAYYLTQESGASEVFDGGIISYANAIKESWLKVSRGSLDAFGAVSEAVVREMLEGALNLSGADFAIATSGVAGPGGGSASKPVGTIFIGVKSKKGGEIIERVLFRGDRNYIQEQSCYYAYLLFLKLFFKTIDF